MSKELVHHSILKQAVEDFNTGSFPCARHTALKRQLCTQPNTQRCKCAWRHLESPQDYAGLCGKQTLKPFPFHTAPGVHSKSCLDLKLRPYLRIEVSEEEKNLNSTVSKSCQNRGQKAVNSSKGTG